MLVSKGNLFLVSFLISFPVPLGVDQLLVFGPKMIDVYSFASGEVTQTIRHKESKKINYLLSQNDDVIISAKAVKGAKHSNVYIMRSVPVGEAED